MAHAHSGVTLPPDTHVLLHLTEADGSASQVELDSYVPHLLSTGEALPLSGSPAPGPQKSSDLGYIEAPDGAVFVLDGEVLQTDQALTYLAQGLREALLTVVRDS